MIPALGARPFFFLHIPKSAGTSFGAFVGARFAPEKSLALRGVLAARHEVLLADPDRYLLVQGHVPYDMHRIFRTRPFVFTILREPVERAISAYFYLRQLAARPVAGQDAAAPWVAAAAAAGRTSLRDFVRTDPVLAARHIGNIQVLLLSRNWTPQYLSMLTTLSPDTTPAHLDRARENLVACDCFGLTERMPETIEMLSYTLRSEMLGYPGWANRTAVRAQLSELDSEELALLRAMTEHDQALYRFGVDLFEQRRRDMLRRLLAERAISPAPPGLADDGIAAFHFDAPIPGEGWYAAERWGEAWCSWTGPEPLSWLMLRSPAGGGAARLEIDVRHAVLAEQIGAVALRVNDCPVAREVEAGPDGHRIVARVPEWLLRPAGEANRIAITVDRVVRPADVDAGSLDSRLLGLAISRVALLAGA